MKTEIGRRKSRGQCAHCPDWVAALIQQQNDPEQDHLSPLWSPYKSSTFPLFSSAAHKLIKLAFPCFFWQREWERHPARCIVGGRRVYEPMRTDTHARTSYYSVSTGVDHRTAILTRMIHLQLLLTAE